MNHSLSHDQRDDMTGVPKLYLTEGQNSIEIEYPF